MVDEIVATFDELEADGDDRAVVITGEPPAFCSGADVSSLGALARAENDTERRSVTSIYEGFLRVLRSSLPTVAAVNGPAVGAGMNLALACDVRIVGDRPPGSTPGSSRSGSTPAAATRGCSSARSDRRPRPRWCCSARSSTARARSRSGSRGRATRPTSSSTAADRIRRRRRPGPDSAARPGEATLRQVPWQPDFEAAIATEVAHQAWSLGQGWFGK